MRVRPVPSPRPLLLVALAALTAVAADAQPLSPRLRVGYDHYRLVDLHAAQSAFHTEFRGRGIPVEAMSSFPPYLSLRLDVALSVRGVDRSGLSVGLGSTGARSHYSDYSGEVRADWVVARRSVGVFVEQDAFRQRGVTGVVALHFATDFARLSYDAAVRVGDERGAYAEALTGRGYSLQPELAAEWAVGPSAFARVGAGYGVTLRGGFGLLPRATYAPEWTGWRLGITLGLRAPEPRLPEYSANPTP